MDINLAGCTAEYRFAVMAMQYGLRVSMPLLDASPYDAIVETPNGLRKIQIKSTMQRVSNNAVALTIKRTGDPYPIADVDFFAIWIEVFQGFYIIPNNGTQRRFKFTINGKKYSNNFNNFGVLV
jgi:hypothetical protein